MEIKRRREPERDRNRRFRRNDLGEAELTALIGDGRVTVRASAGDLVEIPRGIWHSQVTMAPVKLLFITHAAGSESSKNPLGT